eukprot:CAMPEP_0117427802 /NCGR_PEP_ID=MMETSP0758-20121206/7597_1 /TAXON_ID=63605 /ORGANISM="Percolomonas cosmopolitus, Strain AE-1 (ATCC 50343)" /LENGTH=814 /DNA_ID=CAMNT_0005213697 /DNA_START=418 /DNA_END=2859 /DNA_ORIENTATION=-
MLIGEEKDKENVENIASIKRHEGEDNFYERYSTDHYSPSNPNDQSSFDKLANQFNNITSISPTNTDNQEILEELREMTSTTTLTPKNEKDLEQEQEHKRITVKEDTLSQSTQNGSSTTTELSEITPSSENTKDELDNDYDLESIPEDIVEDKEVLPILNSSINRACETQPNHMENDHDNDSDDMYLNESIGYDPDSRLGQLKNEDEEEENNIVEETKVEDENEEDTDDNEEEDEDVSSTTSPKNPFMKDITIFNPANSKESEEGNSLKDSDANSDSQDEEESTTTETDTEDSTKCDNLNANCLEDLAEEEKLQKSENELISFESDVSNNSRIEIGDNSLVTKIDIETSLYEEESSDSNPVDNDYFANDYPDEEEPTTTKSDNANLTECEFLSTNYLEDEENLNTNDIMEAINLKTSHEDDALSNFYILENGGNKSTPEIRDYMRDDDKYGNKISRDTEVVEEETEICQEINDREISENSIEIPEDPIIEEILTEDEEIEDDEEEEEMQSDNAESDKEDTQDEILQEIQEEIEEEIEEEIQQENEKEKQVIQEENNETNFEPFYREDLIINSPKFSPVPILSESESEEKRTNTPNTPIENTNVTLNVHPVNLDNENKEKDNILFEGFETNSSPIMKSDSPLSSSITLNSSIYSTSEIVFCQIKDTYVGEGTERNQRVFIHSKENINQISAWIEHKILKGDSSMGLFLRLKSSVESSKSTVGDNVVRISQFLFDKSIGVDTRIELSAEEYHDKYTMSEYNLYLTNLHALPPISIVKNVFNALEKLEINFKLQRKDKYSSSLSRMFWNMVSSVPSIE